MENISNIALQTVALPEPVFDHCRSLFQALQMRKTSRDISDKKIPLQLLSELLWAAQGINRKHGPFGGPGRTAGSVSNSQEICVYVSMEEGTYLYEPDSHTLAPIIFGDIRILAIGSGQEDAGASAPVRLICVVDIEKFKNAGFQEPGFYDPEIQKSYCFVDTGLIAQNVYSCFAPFAFFIIGSNDFRLNEYPCHLRFLLDFVHILVPSLNRVFEKKIMQDIRHE